MTSQNREGKLTVGKSVWATICGIWSAFKKPWADNWSETLHYLAIAAGLIISGFWVLFTYHAFDQSPLWQDNGIHLRNAAIHLRKW